jgi:hypothetical protein
LFRKTLLLALPVLVIAATALAVFVLERQRTPDWQMALDEYLASTGAVWQDARIGANVVAQMSWNFGEDNGNPQMSGNWPWGIATLPYPPNALRCMLITNGEGEQLLFVAQHTDKLWRIGWIVHVGPTVPLTVAERGALAEVGCNIAAELLQT